jgi:hypothetical protein
MGLITDLQIELDQQARLISVMVITAASRAACPAVQPKVQVNPPDAFTIEFG